MPRSWGWRLTCLLWEEEEEEEEGEEEEEEEEDLKLGATDWQPLYSDCSQGHSSESVRVSNTHEYVYVYCVYVRVCLCMHTHSHADPYTKTAFPGRQDPCWGTPWALFWGHQCPLHSWGLPFIIFFLSIPRASMLSSFSGVRGVVHLTRPSQEPTKALELSSGKDEISLLVEQEFLSLTKEHLILVKESSGDLAAPGGIPQGTREPVPCILAPPLVAGSSERPGASIIAGDNLREQKVAVSVIGSRQDCDSALSTVTGILRAAKIKGTEDGGHSLGASNSEISKLLAQFPLKSTEMSKTPDNKMVLEEARVIKDFLQNSMFSGSGSFREPTGLGPFLLLPSPPPPAPPDKLLELPAQKRQLPVFAKICSKAESDPTLEGHHSMERNPGSKELAKGRESLFLSQWPQSRKDSCSEEGCIDPVGTMSTKKPAWPAKKNLLYEFLGATKNPSGQLRLRSKVEMDGLELKLNPPVTVADKNNLKFTGNVFTPRFATALTSTTVNQPFWLNLNCPPPPVFTNHSTFPQYQGLHPQRSARTPYQQPVHPQLGCYSRQVTPYNPPQMGQQMGQQIFRSSYTPLLSYIPFVQPNYPYPQRTPQKLSTNPRDPSPMAGDGPQYLFPQGYG
ncbi:Hypothetical predicted protein [Marmota monax]|uniref:Uncharacterized protein n=1 Tax=Marmota monax TaxID=9995 RepID=A0A5E4AQ52_MARMO|nr:Hypothetical predicted protein [Marmota monax]